MTTFASFRRFLLEPQLLLEMLRFGLMGAASAGIYFVFFIPLQWCCPKPLWLIGAVAYLLSMVANYLLQRNYTFRSNRAHRQAVGRYIVVQGVGLGINSGLLELATTRAHISLWLTQCVSVVCVAVWSYGAQKLWVFLGKN